MMLVLILDSCLVVVMSRNVSRKTGFVMDVMIVQMVEMKNVVVSFEKLTLFMLWVIFHSNIYFYDSVGKKRLILILLKYISIISLLIFQYFSYCCTNNNQYYTNHNNCHDHHSNTLPITKNTN